MMIKEMTDEMKMKLLVEMLMKYRYQLCETDSMKMIREETEVMMKMVVKVDEMVMEVRSSEGVS